MYLISAWKGNPPEVSGAVESASRRSLLKWALKRVEGHTASLGFIDVRLAVRGLEASGGYS